MFKKLMSFLFEEEEIVEEVTEKPNKQKEVAPVFYQQENHDEQLEEIFENRAKSIFVDSDETRSFAPTQHTPVQQSTFKTSAVDSELKKVKIDSKKSTEYEFSSSISPIFGKLPEKEREMIQVQPKIDLDYEKSILGTIISPIYGIKKRQKVDARVEKPALINTTMSLEDILGVNVSSIENTEQLAFDDQEMDEKKEVEKPKEEILMQLFEEERDS